MKIEKMLAVCYVDKIKDYKLPFETQTPTLVGDLTNVTAKLEKTGYKQYESKEGILFAHEKGEYVFFPEGLGYNFAYATKKAKWEVLMRNWASLDVMPLKKLTSL